MTEKGKGASDPSKVSVRKAEFLPFGEENAMPTPQNLDLILDLNLRVTVELGRTSMSVREVLSLGPGSVFQLDRLAGEQVDILINDRIIAKGEVVVVDENFGVRITDIIAPNKRLTQQQRAA